MEIQFREVNPFDLWFWVEFETVPAAKEQQYVEETFNAWYFLGQLGGFNAENLQIQETGVDLSYLDYDHETADNAMMAPMHNMADFEYEGLWGRCWFDLGTSDPFALDVLLNALQQLAKNYVGIKRIIIGGQNTDWPVTENTADRSFVEN
ncbi:MAG: DUF3531 family protein [Cyanobacteria bacterium P01_H01_bin.15]